MDRGAWRATVNGVAKSRTCLSGLVHMCALEGGILSTVLYSLNFYFNIYTDKYVNYTYIYMYIVIDKLHFLI